MAMQKRLFWALVALLAFFSLNLGVHVWGDRKRTARLEDLERGLDRQLRIAAVENRLTEAGREIALVAGVFGRQGEPGAESPEARAAFAARLDQIDAEIAGAGAIPGSTTPTFEELARVWKDL